MSDYQLLAGIASAVNPVFLAVFIARAVSLFPLRKEAAAFLTRTGAALLLSFLAAHLNRWLHLWKNHGSFPSGHMTFYLALATSLFLIRRRSALVTLPVAFLYGWLMVRLDFHSWLDLGGATFFAVPVALLCHWTFVKAELRN